MMMKTRKIKKVIKSKPTLEGAGVHLNRVFGNNERLGSIPFCSWMIFAPIIPHIISKVFPGIRTAELKQLPI